MARRSAWPGPRSWWRKRQPTVSTRSAVVKALEAGEWSTVREVAARSGIASRRVCAALDWLAVRGMVDVDGGRYRKMERTNA